MKRAWLWAQLAIAYGVLEVALWTTRQTQQIASLVFLAWVMLTAVLQRRSLREMGLGVSGFGRAMIAVLVAAVVSGLILLAGWQAGTLRPLYGVRPPLWHAFGYALWAMIQQFMLQSYFFVNLEELLGSSTKALWGAVLLFTFAHIPNAVLMAGTFVAAVFFVSAFRRCRNIYPLGIAHAMLGLSLAATVPDSWLRHMRVGISYWHFVVR